MGANNATCISLVEQSSTDPCSPSFNKISTPHPFFHRLNIHKQPSHQSKQSTADARHHPSMSSSRWSFECDATSLFVFNDPYETHLIRDAVTLLTSKTTTNKTKPTKTKKKTCFEILSHRPNSVVIAGLNEKLQKKSVLRVTKCDVDGVVLPNTIDARQLAGMDHVQDRLMLFGSSLWENGRTMCRGIVKPMAPPKIVDGCFVVEQFEDVCVLESDSDLFGEREHVNFDMFVQSRLGGDDGRRGFLYLYDVLRGLVCMHEHGWAHLNVAPQNIVLSNRHAYLIDFKNVLPFITLKDGCMKRKDVQLSFQAAFLPPEHFIATSTDIINISSYDAWAFGCILFYFLFREHLFHTVTSINDDGQTTNEIEPEQVSYYFKFGFGQFLKRYHKAKYILLYQSGSYRYRRHGRRMQLSPRKSEYMTSCGDLLKNIFRRCTIVRIGVNNNRAYFCTSRRFGLKDILEHTFWNDYCGVGSLKK